MAIYALGKDHRRIARVDRGEGEADGDLVWHSCARRVQVYQSIEQEDLRMCGYELVRVDEVPVCLGEVAMQQMPEENDHRHNNDTRGEGPPLKV